MNKLKSMLGNKKLLIISVTVVLLSLTSVLAFSYDKGLNIMVLIGQQSRAILDKNDKSIVANINGTIITKSEFESYKIGTNAFRDANSQLTDKELLDKITERQLLYDEAVKHGITVTDDMVNEMVKTQKEAWINDPDFGSKMKDYIAGLNITEDQYWETAKKAFRKSLTIGQYKKNLTKDYARKNKIDITNPENLNQLNQYTESVTKELKDKANIKYFTID